MQVYITMESTPSNHNQLRLSLFCHLCSCLHIALHQWVKVETGPMWPAVHSSLLRSIASSWPLTDAYRCGSISMTEPLSLEQDKFRHFPTAPLSPGGDADMLYYSFSPKLSHRPQPFVLFNRHNTRGWHVSIKLATFLHFTWGMWLILQESQESNCLTTF